MRVCPTCTVSYPDTERFCPRDGTPLRASGADADLVGTVIAERYEVLRKIGEGGMGQVYLAEHVRLRRKSAVKIMHPRLAQDADALSRFNREAANACQIQHPNVAAIYDFGETADGVVYIAMEYVEGDSLSHVLASQGPLAPTRAAELVRQIADGLDAAHRLGIVHRDLKPDNILIGVQHDGREWVRVVDFGISKAADAEGQTVTHTGQVVGTPEYMSPEQLAGGKVDFRSDIYALGLVAFRVLTGELPFQGETPHASMMLRLSERPRRLASTATAMAWTDEMQAVLDRVLSLVPEERHSSASTFAAELRDAAAGVAPLPGRVAAPITATSIIPSASGAPAAIPGAITPGATSRSNLVFPIPSGLSAADIGNIEARLTRSVGPVARVLVRRAAAAAESREALLAMLSREIDDESERARFRREA